MYCIRQAQPIRTFLDWGLMRPAGGRDALPNTVSPLPVRTQTQTQWVDIPRSGGKGASLHIGIGCSRQALISQTHPAHTLLGDNK
ncbi:hypothetical protein FKM82_022092 [Ascaphus truei]